MRFARGASGTDHFWLLMPIVVATVFILREPTTATSSASSGVGSAVVENVPSVSNGSSRESRVDLETKLKAFASRSKLFRDTEISQSSDSLTLTIGSNKIFVIGSAELQAGAGDELRRLAAMLKQIPGGRSITIEAHTDSSPVVKNKARWPTNWELSSARAFKVVQEFQTAGFLSSQLHGLGLADSKPRDARKPSSSENDAHQRRIVVRLKLERSRD